MSWQFSLAILIWAAWWGSLLADQIAQAEVICGPCPPSFHQDIAIEAASTLPCVTSSDPDATRLEFQVERQPGGLEAQILADADCRITVDLFRRARMRLHARHCDATHCAGWGEWSDWIGRLEEFPICLGDLDGDGVVDGDDFVLFRGAYIDGCE